MNMAQEMFCAHTCVNPSISNPGFTRDHSLDGGSPKESLQQLTTGSTAIAWAEQELNHG